MAKNKLAKLLAKHLGKQKLIGFGPLTLTVVTQGVRMPDRQSAGTNPTTTDYACKGRLGTKNLTVVQGGTLVANTVAMISILGATLPDAVEPRPGHRITHASGEYLIIPDGVKNPDGVGAMYECLVREV